MTRPRTEIEDYTPDELLELDYTSETLPLRADAYRRHVAKMDVPDALKTFAARMEKRYGPKVKVHFQPGLPWLEALMVVRYGEDPMQWPPAFSEDDVTRATAWMRGKRYKNQTGSTPNGITYLDGNDDGGFFSVIGLMFAGLVVSNKIAAVLSFCGFVALGTALSNFWENELIDHLFRARSYTAPTDHFVALYTAAPGETGGGTEVTGGSYARVQVAAGFAEWLGTNGETTNVDSAGTGGQTSNRNVISFPTPSANWGTITHFASLNASTSGDFFFYGTLTAPKNVNNGDPAPTFPAAALTFALA